MALGYRYRPLLLSALAFTALAAGASGCGGDENVSDDTPISTGEIPSIDDYPENTLSTIDEIPVTTVTDQVPVTTVSTTAPTTVTSPTTTTPTTTTGTDKDSADNDTPPPPDSPAARFEEFCEQNPGAC